MRNFVNHDIMDSNMMGGHTELCRSECLKSKKNRRLLGDMCKQIHSVAQPDRFSHTHQHTYRAVNELELIFDH